MTGTEDQGVIIPPPGEGHQDTGTLQQEIRDEIRRRQAAGNRIDIDLAGEVELELRNLARDNGIDPRFTEQLLNSENDWNLNPAFRIESHREGMSFLIIWCKKLVRPFVRLYTDFLFRRQAQINFYLFRAIRRLVRDLALQRRDQLDQRYKSAALEQEIHRLRERLRREGIELEPEQPSDASGQGEDN